MDKIKDLWNNLDAKPKKWIIIIGSLVFVIVFLIFLMPNDDTPRTRTAKKDVIQNVLTDQDTTGVSQDAIMARLRSLETNIDATNKAVLDLTKALDPAGLNKRFNAIEDNQKTEALARKAIENRLNDLNNHGAFRSNGNNRPVTTNTNGNPQDPKNNGRTLQTVYENDLPPPPKPVDPKAKKSGTNKNSDIEESVPNIVTVQEDIKEDPKPNPDDDPAMQTYLPATSIVSGVFISGMDAPTAQNARQDPYPALIRIKKDAILPNRFRVDIKECGLLAAGFGDLSSERAYFRSEVITCIREDGAVFEAPIDAYAIGEDGKAGVRGRLVTKQGQYLAKALTAGFLQAASQLFSVQSIPTINVNRDGESNSSPYQQVMSGSALQGAAISGVGGALNRLADFYMKMAGDLFPVIEIDPARSVTFVVEKGVALKFNKVNSGGKK